MIEIRDHQGRTIYIYPHSEGIDFDSADLRDLNLSGAVLEGAMFTDANLSGSKLENADLYWSNFFRADLSNTSLVGASVRGCKFISAKLTNADLRGADFSKDNLGGPTQLQGADLTGCLIEGTNFEHAAYDSMTKLPNGLKPDEHRMVFVEKY